MIGGYITTSKQQGWGAVETNSLTLLGTFWITESKVCSWHEKTV